MSERKKIGLALGAGSTRGMAHIGVIQVLEEHHIPIDLIAGCSIGSLIGGMYCCGVSMDYAEKLATSIDERTLMDFTIPRKGFLRGERLQALYKTLTHDHNFDQTVIPLGIIAYDLDNGEPVVYKEGKIHQAIRASTSIPGIFEPYFDENGHTIVDGGIYDRVPSDVVRQMGADFVIGVDVGFNGGKRHSSGILEVLLHAFDIMNWEIHRRQRENADIMIVPDVLHINQASLAQAAECIELGRKAATAEIGAIMEQLHKAGILDTKYPK